MVESGTDHIIQSHQFFYDIACFIIQYNMNCAPPLTARFCEAMRLNTFLWTSFSRSRERSRFTTVKIYTMTNPISEKHTVCWCRTFPYLTYFALSCSFLKRSYKPYCWANFDTRWLKRRSLAQGSALWESHWPKLTLEILIPKNLPFTVS